MAVIARGLSTWLATIGSGANKKKIIIAAAPPPPVSIQTGKEESGEAAAEGARASNECRMNCM